jgi:hypothetical protein
MEPLSQCNGRRFLDRQEDRNSLGKMSELQYKGDIESYLTEMEMLNYRVNLVGTYRRTLLRDGLSENLQYRLSPTKRGPQNDIDYVESIQSIGLEMEEFFMLQKKHSSKDSFLSLRKKISRESVRNMGTKEKTNPWIVDQEGSLAQRNPKQRIKLMVRLLSIQRRRKPWKEFLLLWVKHDLNRVSVLNEAWTTMHGSSGRNQLYLYPLEAKGHNPIMTIQKMSHPPQEQDGTSRRLRSLQLDGSMR